MENKEIIRKSEDQFKRSNLPLMGVPQKGNRQNRVNNFQRKNTRKSFRTEKKIFLC